MGGGRAQDKVRALFEEIGEELAGRGAVAGPMFGMPSLKVGGKAFAGYFEGAMVFKLPAPIHADAMKLRGARLFDPSGRGRPMKEWVEVPAAHAARWRELAEHAREYVASGARR